MSRRALWLSPASILATGCALFFSDTSSERAHELVALGARLVDVRSDAEWRDGHLKGAIHIPVDQLPARYGELEPTDRPVVVYCRSGVRSSHAKRLLVEAGFTEVYNLGGMGRW